MNTFAEQDDFIFDDKLDTQRDIIRQSLDRQPRRCGNAGCGPNLSSLQPLICLRVVLHCLRMLLFHMVEIVRRQQRWCVSAPTAGGSGRGLRGTCYFAVSRR